MMILRDSSHETGLKEKIDEIIHSYTRQWQSRESQQKVCCFTSQFNVQFFIFQWSSNAMVFVNTKMGWLGDRRSCNAMQALGVVTFNMPFHLLSPHKSFAAYPALILELFCVAT